MSPSYMIDVSPDLADACNCMQHINTTILMHCECICNRKYFYSNVYLNYFIYIMPLLQEIGFQYWQIIMIALTNAYYYAIAMTMNYCSNNSDDSPVIIIIDDSTCFSTLLLNIPLHLEMSKYISRENCME
uniref:Uncharacterized protein n=1 Tax=Onchocerca volvulus TaxID=6282 RepID=A0A8R1XYX5_ONCVO